MVAAFGTERALYLGSYLDLAPSAAIRSVTYVDLDRRAARYFADPDRVAADLAGRTGAGAGEDVEFLEADYVSHLPVPDAAFDLIVSLYAGPTWDHPRRHLAPGGLFLANASHGDASLAALDESLEFVAAVQHRGDDYRLDREGLDTYLVPKKPAAADAELIRAAGKGIAYTRPAFAYVFRLR
ncbi:class I SAM-dependent methyltransferase [Paraoerskovia sediminicola]|uniref:class I SAM-dependent methyltransferase n=1 Tax=Paraoerskovia sediminicola TaxID=1138587 RepID=UPI0025729E11|nr:class I SAM-dependent methyltransferase [Paraoerskovia sediminicola]